MIASTLAGATLGALGAVLSGGVGGPVILSAIGGGVLSGVESAQSNQFCCSLNIHFEKEFGPEVSSASSCPEYPSFKNDINVYDDPPNSSPTETDRNRQQRTSTSHSPADVQPVNLAKNSYPDLETTLFQESYKVSRMIGTDCAEKFAPSLPELPHHHFLVSRFIDENKEIQLTTYSWSQKGWIQNDPQDLKAAEEAIRLNHAVFITRDSRFAEILSQEFSKMCFHPDQQSYSLLKNNCQHQTEKLYRQSCEIFQEETGVTLPHYRQRTHLDDEVEKDREFFLSHP